MYHIYYTIYVYVSASCLFLFITEKFDVHKSVRLDTTMKITNKMHYLD
jgi:hypothetical protein